MPKDTPITDAGLRGNISVSLLWALFLLLFCLMFLGALARLENETEEEDREAREESKRCNEMKRTEARTKQRRAKDEEERKQARQKRMIGRQERRAKEVTR